MPCSSLLVDPACKLVKEDSSEVSMLLHIIGDFEKISDHCSNIAGCVIEMEHAGLDIHKYLKSIKTGENAEFTANYEAYNVQYSL